MHRKVIASLLIETSRALFQFFDKPKLPPIPESLYPSVAAPFEYPQYVPGVAPDSAVPVVPKLTALSPGPATRTPALPEEEPGNKATAVPTGCVPCALGHYGTCTGILNEAVRFARNDGLATNEVIDRVGMCLDELNAMERVDLRPEMIIQLPEWERDLANTALSESRAIRHRLEAMQDPDELEEVAGATQVVRQDLYRAWAKRRLKSMSPEEKSEMTNRILSRLEQEEGGE